MANLGRRSGISEAPVQTSKVNPAGQGPALLALSRVQDKGAWGAWSTKEPGTYSEACECFNVLPFPASSTKRYLALVGQDREGSEEIKGAVTGVGQYFQATLGKEEEGLGGLAIPCCTHRGITFSFHTSGLHLSPKRFLGTHFRKTVGEWCPPETGTSPPPHEV